jgi:hypothetical protein
MFNNNNMTQMSCNFIEQSKIRTIYCEERRNKMATKAISPHLPVVTFGPGPADFQKRPASFQKSWWS